MPQAFRSHIYRIHTQRLILRCWNPADAPLLLEAISASLDHLRRWMPWANDEPETLEDKVRRMQRWRAAFDLGRDFVYGLFTPDEYQVLGAIGSHTRIGGGAREIGYWIRADQTRKGLASEAASALTKAAFELESVHRIEVHCDPLNIASAGVPRKLGYLNQVTIPQCAPNFRTGPRDTAIWTMTRANYSRSVAARVSLEAFDASGANVTVNRDRTPIQAPNNTVYNLS